MKTKDIFRKTEKKRKFTFEAAAAECGTSSMGTYLVPYYIHY